MSIKLKALLVALPLALGMLAILVVAGILLWGEAWNMTGLPVVGLATGLVAYWIAKSHFARTAADQENTMKTEAEIDAIVQAIPEEWRGRWCGGERGDCACIGCAQIGNRAVIAEKITGEKYQGDPEYIDEAKLREHGSVYVDLKLTREEWESWKVRHPETWKPEAGLFVCSGPTGSGKTTLMSKLRPEGMPTGIRAIQIED